MKGRDKKSRDEAETRTCDVPHDAGPGIHAVTNDFTTKINAQNNLKGY